MSSSDETPQDKKDSVSLDKETVIPGSSNQSLQASDAGPSSQTVTSPIPPSSSSRTSGLPADGSLSSQNSRGHDSNASETSQENVQVNIFYSTGGNPSSNSFSCVFPRVNSASGISQQSISSPAPPPMPPSVLHPPVHGQASLSRPSFSYNISLNSDSFHPSPASGNINLPRDQLISTSVSPSFEQSVPGQSLGLNSNSLASVKQNLSTGLSFSGTSLAEMVSSSKNSIIYPVSESQETTFGATLSESTAAAASSSSSQSLGQLPPGFNLNTTQPPILSPAAISVPAVPSYAMPTPRLDSTILPATLLKNADLSSSRAEPILRNIQHPNYPTFPSIMPQTVPPQALWLHPSHASHLQHASFLPAFPMAMQSVPPYAPLPNLQPPGISGPVSSAGQQSVANELVQAGKDFSAPSAPLGGGAVNGAEPPNKYADAAKTQEADAWTSHRTEAGVVYYYNSITGKSTYEKPSCFKEEPQKANGQPIPVSWEKVAGTDWTLVTTNDGKKYYYNNRTKVSSWQIPAEVLEQRKNQDVEPPKEASISIQSPSTVKDNGSVQMSCDDVASSKTAPLISSSALDLIKRKLQDASSSPQAPASAELTGQPSEKMREPNGEANVSESSSDSDDEDGGPTKEECIVQFKEMLKERGVPPFAKWEKELPKIIFDPRFKAVQSHSVRRSLFEHYVRTRAEEERKEKRAAQKALIDGFKELLDEVSEDFDLKMDYQAFKRKWGDDPRFLALGRKERELLLNERIISLKKLAEEKIQALRADFKLMLGENASITSSSRWSRVKDSFRDDPRYRYVKRDDREVFFNEYIAELKAAEAEAAHAAKGKIDEQEKLRKREEEMRKKKQREEQEMESVRLRVRRKEAESSYHALLVEKIKDPKASWTESKPKLEKDPQGRAKNPDLSPADMEKLFRDHVKSLFERCARDYKALLAEVITTEAAEKAVAASAEGGKTILNSWSEAKDLIRSDPRYSKMPSREREALWSRFADDLHRKLRPDSGGAAKETAATVADDVKKRTGATADVLPSGSGRSPKRSRRHRPSP